MAASLTFPGDSFSVVFGILPRKQKNSPGIFSSPKSETHLLTVGQKTHMAKEWACFHIKSQMHIAVHSGSGSVGLDKVAKAKRMSHVHSFIDHLAEDSLSTIPVSFLFPHLLPYSSSCIGFPPLLLCYCYFLSPIPLLFLLLLGTSVLPFFPCFPSPLTLLFPGIALLCVSYSWNFIES